MPLYHVRLNLVAYFPFVLLSIFLHTVARAREGSQARVEGESGRCRRVRQRYRPGLLTNIAQLFSTFSQCLTCANEHRETMQRSATARNENNHGYIYFGVCAFSCTAESRNPLIRSQFHCVAKFCESLGLQFREI